MGMLVFRMFHSNIKFLMWPECSSPKIAMTAHYTITVSELSSTVLTDISVLSGCDLASSHVGSKRGKDILSEDNLQNHLFDKIFVACNRKLLQQSW